MTPRAKTFGHWTWIVVFTLMATDIKMMHTAFSWMGSIDRLYFLIRC